MSESIQAALLGVVQGLTEFLPVSSSAHLVLAKAFFGFDDARFGLSFEVACHVGTLVAVLVYFRDDLMQMLASTPRALTLAALGNRPEAGHDRGARLIWMLVFGTLPIVVVGVLFADWLEAGLRTPQVTAVTMTLGALGFFVAERIGRGSRADGDLTLTEAVALGCAQAVALVPGVSRSGATITLALLLGMRRAEAARFIFLLGIPAVAAAAVREAPAMLTEGAGTGASLFAIGVVTSAVVGYLSIRFFIRYLGRHSLAVFAWYRLAIALAVVIWLAAGRSS
jgi:undecaprenyl-diphosphatase